MAYLTVSEFKQYRGITRSDDDSLISTLIDAAEDWLELEANQVLYTDTNSTRYYDAVADVYGRELHLDAPLAEINSVTTNADGTADVLSSSDYVTMPRNNPPYYGLKMLSSSDYTWTFTTDAEMGIEVSGKWCLTTDLNRIRLMTMQLVNYAYTQKDSQVFDTIAIPDAGVISVPNGFPATVGRWLQSVRRS
jgi:hypothetical protein